MYEYEQNERDLERDLEINYNLLQKIRETWTREEVDWYLHYILNPLVASPLFNNFRFYYIQEISKILEEKEIEEQKQECQKM